MHTTKSWGNYRASLRRAEAVGWDSMSNRLKGRVVGKPQITNPRLYIRASEHV
jgi:hypothetical protein